MSTVAPRWKPAAVNYRVGHSPSHDRLGSTALRHCANGWLYGESSWLVEMIHGLLMIGAQCRHVLAMHSTRAIALGYELPLDQDAQELALSKREVR